MKTVWLQSKRHGRAGFTLIELLIVVAIIAILIYVGASSLSLSAMQETRNGAADVVGLFQRARYVASRQNSAVVVVIYPYGTEIGGETTRGRLEAYLVGEYACPGDPWVPGTPFEVVEMGDADDTSIVAPGLVVAEPESIVTNDLCIRPNGRIIERATSAPIPPLLGSDPEEMSGKGFLWIQHNPLRLEAGELVVPYISIEIPFNGLVAVPQ